MNDDTTQGKRGEDKGAAEDGAAVFLERDALQTLLALLQSGGYRLVGPQVRDGAIVYETLGGAEQLPRGWHDEQAPGRYRLHYDPASPRLFAWANGPQALKPLVFAPRELLWEAHRDETGNLRFQDCLPSGERIAVIGVRACDLAALALQDAHFLEGPFPDAAYHRRRTGLFLVAVDCSHPAETCFCAATGDGPRVEAGKGAAWDLRLQELEAGFLVEAGSRAGAAYLARLPARAATEAERAAALAQAQAAVARQTRRLPAPGPSAGAPCHDAAGLAGALTARHDHPHWHDVAQRCLACGNCTAVCPTCFCAGDEEVPDLAGTASRHYRQWDSCFTAAHSYIHGIVIRAETRHRYRQWLTHKLDTWHAQYGRSGCVGCGRCITWCPAGIDLTAEAEALVP